MRKLKLLLVGLLLTAPGLATAAADDTSKVATWYLHVDIGQMRSEGPGRAVYDWMDEEVFAEIKEDTGIDLGNEFDRLTAFSLEGQGPVFLFEGNISQESKDMIMTLIAAEGDLQPLKSSRKSYYRLTNNGDSDNPTRLSSDSIEVELESLGDESWISMDIKNRLIVTSSEEQMKDMLKNGGKIAGNNSHTGSLLVLTAEKTLLQAGMNSIVFGGDDDGDSGWDSNILRNTEQVAVLVAAAADKLAIEAKLITAEPEMAQSLASVARGLVSLLSFDDSMNSGTAAMLRGTKIEADGNALSISLAIDPELVVSNLSD
jgi:hypothetical protein